jgi:hypothetical protein
MNWKSYFNMMSDWKCLPAYRAEPRIDSLIGYFLKEILSEYFNKKIVGIIPELPIRLGTVKPQHDGKDYSDRSYKVDFYCLGADGQNYLIEFKTDSSSRRPAQDNYLIEAQNVGMKGLVEGICKISIVSSYKIKYGHLLQRLRDIGLLDKNNGYIGKKEKIEIVYIQPTKKDEDVICVDFVWISDWLKRKYPNEEYEEELANALYKWKND